MGSFIDPRVRPTAASRSALRPRTADPAALEELHHLCREGRLYEIEEWIRAGRPLQLAEGVAVKKQRWTSALAIGLERQNHALILLLLCNGYDPNLEGRSPLDAALGARRWDLVDLLLEWGADPNDVSLEDLFGTYNLRLFERFFSFGVDLTAGHALAAALGYHTSNKPLFGFARKHREHNPKIQRELNIALACHAERGNEKGVQLCLWAGADPHSPVPSLRYSVSAEDEEGEDEDEHRFVGRSAVYEACSGGHAVILERLEPDPARDDFEQLYCSARSAAVIDVLARVALPENVGAVIHSQLMRMNWGFDDWAAMHVLERLFEVGVRWSKSSGETIGAVRWSLLKLSDSRFVEVMKLLATRDYCAPEILKELARTPAIRSRMKKVGFFPPSPDDPDRFGRFRPTRSREVLSKFGVELPKVKQAPPRLPRTVRIGGLRSNGRELRLDRAALFKAVWSKPATRLAEEWGISGTGLAKALRRLRIPVPPRGYWARRNAGQRVRWPTLPQLEPGEAEEIIVFVPE